jgi:tRNA splicing endonuclease
MRYRVFKDLTLNKGYYVTDGVKFGSEMLVYKGEPLLYHSSSMVKVVDS